MAIYISSYLRLHHLWLSSAESEDGTQSLCTGRVGQQVHHRALPRQLGQLAFLSVSAFRESEGDGGTAIVRDCTTEWRNVLTLGTQKYFSCK